MTAVVASRPTTMAVRGIGEAISRSMKPDSMSSASAIPPLTAASIVDWTIAPASSKSRKPATFGNAGMSVARPGAAHVHREEERREDDDRHEELRPAERLPQRAHRQGADDAGCLLQAGSGSGAG